MISVRPHHTSDGHACSRCPQALKFAGFPKLFRTQADPGLISSILSTVAGYVTGAAPLSPEEAAECADALCKLVESLARTPSFDMSVMMFTRADKAGAECAPHALASCVLMCVGVFVQFRSVFECNLCDDGMKLFDCLL